jgi:hypothetical protein
VLGSADTLQAVLQQVRDHRVEGLPLIHHFGDTDLP